MKKTLKRLAICLALVTVLAVSAFAADFTHCADALKDLGLFQGTSTGYQLDRAPTRAEAATMLVRLLGQEEAAKELTYTAPFTDVPAWAQPYVQYLYENGLTSGKTATTFAPDEICSAQMYTTFLMRALGYSDKDGKDFKYADAVKFATEKGVANALNCDEANFLRDDVVALSYTALATAPQDGAEANLLQKLMKAGVIKDAKGYDDQFRAYRDYAAAVAAQTVSAKQHMKAEMQMKAAVSGVEMLTGTMNLDMIMDMNLEKLDASKIAMTGKLDMSVNPALQATDNTFKGDVKYYYADGYYYVDLDGKKAKMALSFDEIVGALGVLSDNAGVDPLCMLKSITVDGGTYSVAYADSVLTSVIESALSGMEGMAKFEIPELATKNCTVKATFKNGQISAQLLDAGMALTLDGQTLDVTVTMAISNVGDNASVTLPTDLDTYPEATEATEVPAA